MYSHFGSIIGLLVIAIHLGESLIADLFSRHHKLTPMAKLEVPDQIRAANLSFEDFNITTPDGYILNLWHVWDPSAQPAVNKKTGEQKTIFM